MIIPLIDSDVLVYEVGFGCMTGWKAVTGQEELDAPPPFDYVAELLDNKIQHICNKIQAYFQEACFPPALYLTGKGNFREKLAVKRPYKGNRDQEKPFHYENIRAYLMVKYGAIVVNGMEADDAMCIDQLKNCNYEYEIDFNLGDKPTWLRPSECYSIICSRDKDLRQCPGWHYGWELGHQKQFGPEFVEGFGYIKLSEDNKKLTGVGDKFFYAQLIMGDRVDNVPGIPKAGPKQAYNALEHTTTSMEAELAVSKLYQEHCGETWKEEMLEQGQLLWMVRELDQEGKPVMWKPLQRWEMDQGEISQLYQERFEENKPEVAAEVGMSQ